VEYLLDDLGSEVVEAPPLPEREILYDEVLAFKSRKSISDECGISGGQDGSETAGIH